MAKEVVILGAYGQQNIGDEALLEAILAKMGSGDLRISVNSMNPKETSHTYGIRSFHTPLKKDFWKKVKAFSKADTIIYGGGTLLVELRMVSFSKRTPLYRGFVINLLSKIAGKKVIYIAVGVEPVQSRISKALINLCVRLSDICYVRDAESFNLLKEYKCPENRIFLGTDPVTSFRASGAAQDSASKRILILPAYRILDFEKHHKQYVKELSEYAEEMARRGYHVEFYSMSNYAQDQWNDQHIIKLLQERIKGGKSISFKTGYLRPEEFSEYIAKFDIVLSSRFHGLVFSSINTVPSISLTNYAKCESYMKAMGLGEFSLASKDIRAERLAALTERILGAEGRLKAEIRANQEEMQRSSDNMLNYIQNIIANES